MKRLLLIDGSSLLFTSFFASAPKAYLRARTDEERDQVLHKMLKTNSGLYTNGVLTMTRMLLKLTSQHGFSHLAVAWDISRETHRKERYALYKAHRPEARPELGEQFGTMQRVLKAMNIAQFKVDGFEADDIIGTLADRFEREIPVIIVTKDQDALQLVSEHTRVWLQTSKADEYRELCGSTGLPYSVPDGYFEFTPITFEAVYGLSPVQMVDKKALEGDSSDNIPGVKGVGEASVVPLLQEFRTVEELYAHIENLCPADEAAMKELFKALGLRRSPLSYLLKDPSEDGDLVGKRAAELSKELASIHRTVPIIMDVQMDSLQIEIDRLGMVRVFEELEFKALLKAAM
ncbi:5'-3' exonuclease [Alicyclobacillus sp. ALC3]|uniref:5'-3' exonuclease n=1 Tax=Alicyclobacillus sp. ALC3 TaxID=2796143 RepID=UPI0023785291|nr:5'-3' exonuclease H3TH domain-containing protein [Alicyclobacillus sp. ALC3]WDL99207.1 5'-3' exonuclease [Alicyclobacillus sp. ALC3]